MDRQLRNLIVLGSAFACFTASALAQSSVDLREASWLASDHRIFALTNEPALDREQVLEAAASAPFAFEYQNLAAFRADLELGEHLFRTPLLLGGQAAKAGLSCNSCHVSGRSNPAFQFPAISGEAGTADTTHNFFSETLGNGEFDPGPIPDLTQPGKVSHDLETRDLERFLGTIVVEEFGGDQPAQGVIEALSTYVRALRVSQQPASVEYRARSIMRDLADAKTMTEHAMSRLDSEEAALPNLLLAGARDRLAIIHERLIAGEHDVYRAWLTERSREMGAVQAILRDEHSQSNDARRVLSQALSKWDEMPDFELIERSTYYSKNTLIIHTEGQRSSLRGSPSVDADVNQVMRGVSRIAE